LYLEKPKDQGGWQSIHATLHELTRFQPEDGFRGVLRQVGLQDVLQMECLARHSVVLHVRAESIDGRVFVKDGQITHAQCAGRKGEEAFNQLLSLTGGEFDLLPFTEPPEQSINGSWEFLLMEAARQRDESGDPEAGSPAAPANDIPDMFQVPPAAAPAAPVGARQAAPSLVGPPAPAVELPKPAVRLVEQEPETALPAEASRPRTDELLVCSLQGEILHEWKCANPNGRVTFLEFVSQKARQLAQGLPVGEFDRVEVNAVNTRVIAQVQAERGLFVRCSRVPLEGEGNSFGA
jgi:hypothetical protein